MKLSQFKHKLAQESKNYGNVVHTFTHLMRQVVVNRDGDIYIDGALQEETFTNLEEARKLVKQAVFSEKLKRDIQHQVYEDISDMSIANIIKKHHEIPKVTSQLIESYVDLSSSKLFTVDPVVMEMRKLNKLSNLVEGKIDFVLDDGTQVAISEDTYLKIVGFINKSGEKDLVTNYMRESKEHFLHVVEDI
jgi:hypothetical protein